MNDEEMKHKIQRLAELYMVYYRLLVSMNEKYQEEEKIRVEMTQLAKEIEDYDKEKENGEKLC